jgi:hypothetical protein
MSGKLTNNEIKNITKEAIVAQLVRLHGIYLTVLATTNKIFNRENSRCPDRTSKGTSTTRTTSQAGGQNIRVAGCGWDQQRYRGI